MTLEEYRDTVRYIEIGVRKAKAHLGLNLFGVER